MILSLSLGLGLTTLRSGGGTASLSLVPAMATTDLVIGGAIGKFSLRGWKSPRLTPSTATTDLVIGGLIGVLK